MLKLTVFINNQGFTDRYISVKVHASVKFPVKTMLHEGTSFCQLPQVTKLTFFSRSHLAPKFFKVVAKSKKLVAIKKKKRKNKKG